MEIDKFLRLPLHGFFFGIVPVALFHRVCSQTDENIDRWQEGAVILFGQRLGAVS